MTELDVSPPVVLSHLVSKALVQSNVTVGWTTSLFVLYAVLHFTGCALPKFPLTERERGEWNVRVVSTFNAVVCIFGSVLCLADVPNYTQEQCIFGFRPVPLFFCRMFLGYLLFDLLLEISCGAPVLRNPSAVAHHLLWVFLNSYVLAYNVLPVTFSWLTLGEVSTPCLNARWFLAVTKQERSKRYLVNGVALMLLFFVARIVVYGVGLVHTWSLRDLFMAPDQPLMHTLVVALATLGYGLNIYWMGLIVKGAARAFKRKQK